MSCFTYLASFQWLPKQSFVKKCLFVGDPRANIDLSPLKEEVQRLILRSLSKGAANIPKLMQQLATTWNQTSFSCTFGAFRMLHLQLVVVSWMNHIHCWI